MQIKSFMKDMIQFELEDAVGRENVSTSKCERDTYSVDYFWISRTWQDRGAEGPLPDIIVRPGCTEEVSKVLKIANYYKIPVHTWGGGSGSQGGALPMAGGILLDMKKKTHLIELDENAHSITAEAGMIFQQLEWYANEKGFSCMHIPSCLTCGTIGGALGHRGIGIFSSKYGKIDDMCMSMEVVLPNGDIIHTLPVPKHAAGPDLNQIFIGSEGTLGIITKATFRLFEHPECRKHRAFMFIEMKIVQKICAEHGGRDMGSEYGEKWFENRITFFYPDNIMDIPQMFGTMDTVADFSHIEKIYWAMKKAVEENFPGVRFIAHCSHWYGWGTMIYDRFIMDNPPEDKEEALRLHNQIWNTGVRAAMENGGVINDHHGIGLKLSRLMKEQYGPAFQVLEGLKKTLDPNGIMNPYKLGL